jgi:hypothetical protein
MRKFDVSPTIPNPYFEHLSREINFRLDFRTIDYFENLGKPYGYSAEEMMHRYLRYLAGAGFTMDIGEPTLAERRRLEESTLSEERTPPPV